MRLSWLSIRGTGKKEIADYSFLPTLWNGLGALLAGILLAKWVWTLFAPLPTTVVVRAEHDATTEAGQLFGVAVSGITSGGDPSEGIALPNVRLVGVFAARMGQPGFAVLKLDDKQQVGVVVGEKVVPGTILIEAHPDYVLLERAGVRQRVNLEEKSASVPVASVPPVLPVMR